MVIFNSYANLLKHIFSHGFHPIFLLPGADLARPSGAQATPGAKKQRAKIHRWFGFGCSSEDGHKDYQWIGLREILQETPVFTRKSMVSG